MHRQEQECSLSPLGRSDSGTQIEKRPIPANPWDGRFLVGPVVSAFETLLAVDSERRSRLSVLMPKKSAFPDSSDLVVLTIGAGSLCGLIHPEPLISH